METLFPRPDISRSMFAKVYIEEELSFKFLECADAQLTAQFVKKKTGLKPSKQVRYTWSASRAFSYKRDTAIYINHDWNDVILKVEKPTGARLQLYRRILIAVIFNSGLEAYSFITGCSLCNKS